MKYFRRHFNFKRSINKKYGECLQHKINIISFLKSNYKYKRRSASCRGRCQQRRRVRYQQQNPIYPLPADEPITSDGKQISKKIPFYENSNLDKFLRMFILIMQQATPSKNNNNFLSTQSKNNYNTPATRLLAKLKAINETSNKSRANAVWENNDKDGIDANNRAHKDANKDTDRNVDISNIPSIIIHQQDNYDKVSTITSTLITCQRRNHHQIKTTNSSLSSSPSPPPSTQSTTISMKTTATLTVLSSPPMEKNENCPWTAMLRHYASDNPSIHEHQHHRKTKHTQHTNSFNSCRSSKSASPGTIDSRSSMMQTVVNATWSRRYGLSCLLFTLFVAFTIGIRSTAAGACWQTVLESGKCNEIFSLNISKSECCGANQEFAYTDREPTNVEYFFATAIGGGMECSPCLESCANVKCGVNKKCVKRKGRPKCVCAPECGAARRKRKQKENFIQQEQQSQHHSALLVATADDDGYFPNVASSTAFKVKLEKSQQSRDTRSLSSEITNINLGLKNGKDAMISSDITLPVERHRCKEHNKNQRKSIHTHMHHEHKNEHQHQHSLQPNHKNQEPKGTRRLLITANVEHTEKPTTRRLQIFSNIKTTQARRLSNNNNNNKNSKNKYDQHEEPLSPYYDGENNEDKNYNDAEDNAKEANMKSTSNDNRRSNNKNNRTDNSKKLLNQSPSRHKLKTNIKQNSSSINNKNRSKPRHDLKTTKKRQHSINNNSRAINPQQNGHHAENSSHHRHHNHHQHHRHQQQPKQQQQQQEHKHNSHRQQSQNHSIHKHNHRSEHHKGQTIAIKKPKHNKDYNTTTASKNINNNNNMKIAVVNTATTTTTAEGKNPSNSDAYGAAIYVSSAPLLHSVIATSSTPLNLSVQSTTATAATYNTSPQDAQTPQLSLPSSATFSFSTTTPLNSIASASDNAAADDHYHSRLQNHGSKIATSSLLSSSSSSSSSPSSSYSQMSAAPALSSAESSVVTTMSAEGEGVSHHDHNHHTEMPRNSTYNNENNNDDDVTATLQSNLHKTQQLQQQEQLQQTQPQPQPQPQPQLQHHYQTPLFDGISEQFDLIGLQNNKQQQHVTNGDNVGPLNPVCGTDGRTYNTECQLRKRACRTDNPNLQIAYIGHCRTTCNGVKCLNGLTCVEDQYSLPHCITCKIECPRDDYDNDPDATNVVCGADGKTYRSACDINRMICKIGRSISVAYPGPCRADEVTCDDIICGPKQVCLIDLLTHKPRCTSCRYKCSRKRRPPSSHLYEGKICGFNNRSYNSWCEMRKDSCSTGFYIDVKYSGDCH